MMRSLLVLVACLALAGCQSGSTPGPKPAPQRVVILGDGHCTSNPAVPGSAGWGSALGTMLAKDVEFTDLSTKGYSMEVFPRNVNFHLLAECKPTVVIIGFGWSGEGRDYLETAATCRKIGATPIFVTPPALRTVDPVTGKIFPGATNQTLPNVDWTAEQIRKAGAESGVAVLDLHAWTKKTWAEIGDRACFFLHPPKDPAALNASNVRKGWVSPAHRNPLYFSTTGAETLAHWIAIQLRTTPLAGLIRPVDGPPSDDYKLVWQDEFNGASWSTNDWYCHSGPRKDGWNNPDNVKLDGKGNLVFRIERGPTNEVFCGVIDTRKARTWTYGYFESRCTIAREPGMWNAFWLTGNKMADPERGRGKEDDTFNNGTEVDVLEYLVPQGDVVHMNLHWNGYKALHKSSPFDALVPGLREREYHVYGVEWRPDGYTFYCDGRRMWETKDAIAGTDLFVLLSVEIGKWAGDIANAKLPHEIKYDWVRVWQKPAPRP